LNVYVDASVLLRVVFGEAGRVRIWPRIEVAVASELVMVECLRTIDRARILRGLDDREVARRRTAVYETLDRITLVGLEPTVLERAAQPFPTSIGTLDAIHLATALAVRDRFDELSFATHDQELGIAARAVGFPVHGS
jgi:predicted nucleic acid-binding protein